MLRDRLLLGLLIGALIGIVIGIEVVDISREKACPENFCLDRISVIPITDRMYFTQVHDILKNSKKSIHMIVFEIKYYPTYQDSLENILVRDLIEAKKRGVDVKILVDGSFKENSALDYLKKNGIDIRYDAENVTTHAKIIIVDNKIVIIGSTNWSYYSLEKNYEANVVLISELIADYFDRYFQRLWNSD